MRDISTSLHYAVELLSVMTSIRKKERKERPVSLREVASLNTAMSLHFLEQIARKLRMAEILKVIRGPGGGYLVTKDQMDALNIRDLMDANILRNTANPKEIPPFKISKSLEAAYNKHISEFMETKIIDLKGFGKNHRSSNE